MYSHFCNKLLMAFALTQSNFLGILVMERPCGVVLDVKELFGSESKSQVYAHIHNLLSKTAFSKTSQCIKTYDASVHSKSCNTITTVSILIRTRLYSKKVHFVNE